MQPNPNVINATASVSKTLLTLQLAPSMEPKGSLLLPGKALVPRIGALL
jgi:hypothetical protein